MNKNGSMVVYLSKAVRESYRFGGQSSRKPMRKCVVRRMLEYILRKVSTVFARVCIDNGVLMALMPRK